MSARFPVAPKQERTLDGVTFASKREMQRYAALKLFEKAGKITNLELQPEFQTFISGKPFCKFTADFSYWINDGTEQVIEDVKSSGTAKDTAYRLRKRAAELQYGFKVTEVVK
ncbi:MAG: DUF1064 domain-containing protein [Hyphomicrobium sp.]|uniref:DUF1064 domain-containing protein n=1 Tax=Hyphomicrobium sp. TaxID=82 RepID=UPI00356B5EE3